ncbi:MAG: NADH dehydrogenase FAD-containing subunit [Lentisphaerae bacterium]|nr:NADH dehydrogenase FAD-containing subunit [Lentisphaerota bacterium]
MIAALILLPIGAAVVALLMESDVRRRRLLVGTAAAHLGLTALYWCNPPTVAADAWLGFDSAGRIFLGISSVLFLAVAFYGAYRLGREQRGRQAEVDTGMPFINAPEAVYTACLLLFLAMMTLVAASRHLGVLWVALEATTLTTAPLIYFHRQPRSLEATWKYLLVCSVGIALALLGNFLLVVASAHADGSGGTLVIRELVARGAELRAPWMKAAFVFLLVGYGTKMGLVPMHTWLPDAHSEAPSLVSALLSGALLNCAFLGILRTHSICAAAGIGDFSGNLLIVFGLISMVFAAAFLVNQADYKRMLAYSSIEHMGLLALGAGLGGAALYGALLHAVNHSLVKAALFMVAGNFVAAYRTKLVGQTGRALHWLPVSGGLWLLGVFAITGSPPFGTFVSEFTMLRAAFAQGREWVAVVALVALGVAFIGMTRTFLCMALGPEPGGGKFEIAEKEQRAAVIPALVLMGMSLWLGLWIPGKLHQALAHAARLLGGRGP